MTKRTLTQALGLASLAAMLASCQCSTTCVAIGCLRSTEVILPSALVEDGEYVIQVNPLGAPRNTCEVGISAGMVTHACDHETTHILTASTDDAGTPSGIVGIRVAGHHDAADIDVMRDGVSVAAGRARLDHRRPSVEGACDTDRCRVHVLMLP